MSKENILVVDDDIEVRTLVADVLSDEGYVVQQASNEQEAITCIRKENFSLIFLDLWIGEDESAGLKILSKIKKTNIDLPVVIISGHGTIDVAVKAIQEGAFDFIEKPFVIDRLLITAQTAIELYRLKQENATLKNNKFDVNVLGVGESPFAQSVKLQISKIAEVSGRVFVKSDVGCGANIAAFAIHQESGRKGPFVYVNCVSDDHIKFENDLFGSEKSYGFIEHANFGTLYLEEISRLSQNAQRKLLEFFQNGFYFEGKRRILSDLRVICSSSVDINSEIENGNFIGELFYRLNVFQLIIPPLSARKMDVMPLAHYFISKSNVTFSNRKIEFSPEAISWLQAFSWPGNIRQLQNVVENILINATGKTVIDVDCLPPEITSETGDKYKALDAMKLISLPLKEAKDSFESDYLLAQVNRFSGNISRTAAFVGMERSALHRKLKALNVEVVRNRNKEKGTFECKH